MEKSIYTTKKYKIALNHKGGSIWVLQEEDPIYKNEYIFFQSDSILECYRLVDIYKTFLKFYVRATEPCIVARRAANRRSTDESLSNNP